MSLSCVTDVPVAYLAYLCVSFLSQQIPTSVPSLLLSCLEPAVHIPFLSHAPGGSFCIVCKASFRSDAWANPKGKDNKKQQEIIY